METERPDPDELLAALTRKEQKNKRGKLKIFFGMCAGVGKTYSMLQAAHAEKKKEVDLVIGYIETHKRRETEALVEGLEIIPRKSIAYKSTVMEEMDLDAIIARKPQLVLVDELAHSNAQGCRHNKRYQDVVELLDAGIDVFSTLNVQHLESRTDTVAQITGVLVRETLPDSIFENSDEVELVDLTPDELLQRLQEGKVYSSERSREAVQHFFRKGNITALREMSLRLVADRVDSQLHDYMQDKRIKGPWKSGIRFLVAIGTSPSSGGLLKWAKSLSYTMGASIEALYVETARRLPRSDNEQLQRNIDLARQLGFAVRIVTSEDPVKAIVEYARKENITHIIVGKTRDKYLFNLYKPRNFVNRILKYSGDIDVYILGSDNPEKEKISLEAIVPSFNSRMQEYLFVALIVFLTSLVSYGVHDFVGYQVVSCILLFMVSILALFYGTGPILFAAASSALIWDYFFIPPQFTFLIQKPLDILLLFMFFIIALLNGTLTSRVRRQEKRIRMREERTHALYELSRKLTGFSSFEDVVKVSLRFINVHFGMECAMLLKNDEGKMELQHQDIGIRLSENEYSIIHWVENNGTKAGRFTETLPSNPQTYYPLTGSTGVLGVIVLKQERSFTYGEEQFRESAWAQISGKYERELLRNVARKAYVVRESEKLYKTLFNSISHELRIPIATIMGSSEMLMDQAVPAGMQQQLYSEINTASLRLNRLVENLLNMSRLESGRITVHSDWCDVQDLINDVAESLRNELENYRLIVELPEEHRLMYADYGLMEQVFHNLILNATQHAPAQTSIYFKMTNEAHGVRFEISDEGPGFPAGEAACVFDKFYRGKEARAGGTGLGLSIVKGFVEAHRGTITAANKPTGGAWFNLFIPSK